MIRSSVKLGAKGSSRSFRNADLDESEMDSEVDSSENGSFGRTSSAQPLPTRTLRQRIWRFLEDPSSTPYARLWSTFMLLVILLSSTTFIVGSLTQFQQEINPVAVDTFNKIEYFCIACFTLEYLLRFFLAPAPSQDNRVKPSFSGAPSRIPSASSLPGADMTPLPGPVTASSESPVNQRPSMGRRESELRQLDPPPAPASTQPEPPSPFPGEDRSDAAESPRAYLRGRLRFVAGGMNLVDLLAIIPFYIELAVNAAIAQSDAEGGDSGGAGALAIVRIIRIARIFRLLKLGKNQEGLSILGATVRASFSFLVSISFLLLIVEVIAASLIFFIESGDICLIQYRCKGGDADKSVCSKLMYREGADIPPVLALGDSLGVAALGWKSFSPPNGSSPDPSLCPGGTCEAFDNQCYMADGTLSRFSSIPLSLWFVTVTMCTVGFGDLAPQTDIGKVLGALTALMGLILLALPTTVLGMEFQKAYIDFQARKRVLERRQKLERAKEEAARERQKAAAELTVASAKVAELQQLMASMETETKGMTFKERQRFIIEIQLAADAKKQGVPDHQIIRTLGPIATNELANRRQKRYLNIINSTFRAELSRQELSVLGARALQEALAAVPKALREETAALPAQPGPLSSDRLGDGPCTPTTVAASGGSRSLLKAELGPGPADPAASVAASPDPSQLEGQKACSAAAPAAEEPDSENLKLESAQAAIGPGPASAAEADGEVHDAASQSQEEESQPEVVGDLPGGASTEVIPGQVDSNLNITPRPMESRSS